MDLRRLLLEPWRRHIVRRHGPQLWAVLVETTSYQTALVAYREAIWSGALTHRGFVRAAWRHVRRPAEREPLMAWTGPTPRAGRR